MNRGMEAVRKGAGKLRIIATGALPLVCLYCEKITAFAGEDTGGGGSETYDFNWLTDGTHDNHAFNDLTTTVMDTGGSLYKLMMAVGAIGLLISLIACGLMIAVGTNANKRSEHISHLMWVAVGGIVIFGAMSIISLMQSIGGNI